MHKEFDFIILGGGSAGYAAARTAVEAKLRVALVEGGEQLGGLCILKGCMPSKTLLESANRFLSFRHAEKFGLWAKDFGFSSEAIRTRKELLVEEFASYRSEQLEKGHFHFVRGNATFLDAKSVHVDMLEGGSLVLKGRSFLIATGSEIKHHNIQGLDLPDILTSNDLLTTAEVPASVIILGAGPVALEAAHYYEALGSKVTILQRSEHLLHSMDEDVSDALKSAFIHRGMHIFTGTKLQKIEGNTGNFSVHFEHLGENKSVQAAAVLNALGRQPRIDSLGLEKVGVAIEGGRIRITAGQQTSARNIFAAGDVCGPHEIVHLAIQQGEVAARNAFRLLRWEDDPFEKMDYRLKVFATFTEPQVATVGASEKELQAAGIPFLSASYPFADHGKALIHGALEGFVKILAHRTNGEILGASIIGPEASELIHEIVVAMRYHATVQEFAQIPHYHPTLAEIWLYPAEVLAERCGKRFIG